MRASDEDRQRAVDELRRHCAAGRIDVDEYASRVERALSAGTLAELDEIRGDLPMLRIAEPGGHGIWAGQLQRHGRAVSRGLPAGDHAARREATAGQRVLALGVAVITVAVVLAAIALGLAAEWAWAAVLLGGWVAGMAQGRLSGRRGRAT